MLRGQHRRNAGRAVGVNWIDKCGGMGNRGTTQTVRPHQRLSHASAPFRLPAEGNLAPWWGCLRSSLCRTSSLHVAQQQRHRRAALSTQRNDGPVRWLVRGLEDLRPSSAQEMQEAGVLVEGAGRLLRVLHQLPARRYRWVLKDEQNQEWRLNTGAIRFAISGVQLPADTALVGEVLAKVKLAAQHLQQSISDDNGGVEHLWRSLMERRMTTVTPEEVVGFLWPGKDTVIMNGFEFDVNLTSAARLYAAHRILDTNYEFFARSSGRYHIRTLYDQERIDVEKRLFDLKSKSLLLFLLRIDRRRRIRRAQRSGKHVPSTTAATVAPSTSSEAQLQLEQSATHVTHLPSGFDLDLNVVRPLLTSTELLDAEWWDPRGRDVQRIKLIEQYALTQERENSTSPYIRDAVLKPLGYRGSAGDAFSCLVELGVFDEFANMHRLRAAHLGIHEHPTEQCPSMARSSKDNRSRLSSCSVDTSLHARTDVSHHTVYTIDDASTTEVDDGISIDLNDPDRWVFVHIADPTASISIEHEIEKYARERVSTIYLPESTYPMMQPSVYRQFSLEPNRDNQALTFGIKFNKHSGAIDDFTIFSSVVSRVKKLTYEQVDGALSVNKSQARQDILRLPHDRDCEILAEMHSIALLRKKWRLEQGAQSFHLPKPLVKVINTPHLKRVQVSADERMSPAQELVAEMMIAANQVAGIYAARHELPVPFRHQTIPQELDPALFRSIKDLPEPIKNMELVRHMQAAELSLVPFRHTGLGLETYVQVTSPIRRFSDIIAHRQIKAHLANIKLPYQYQELQQDLLPHIQQRSKHIKELVQQTNTFWVLQYFMRTSRKKLWDALTVRLEEEPSERYPYYLVRVFFPEIGWSRAIRLPRCPQPGESLQLQLNYVSPHTETIVFKEVL